MDDINFKKYRRAAISELRPYVAGESLENIAVADSDKAKGSPQLGDMIARNPNDHSNQWLMNKDFFASAQFELVEG